MLPEFTCGQVMLPEYPPVVDSNAQNRLKCGHFMLPAPAILWVKSQATITTQPLFSSSSNNLKNTVLSLPLDFTVIRKTVPKLAVRRSIYSK
jgi:hypothetical protein